MDNGGDACCPKDLFDIPRRSAGNDDEIPAVGFEAADAIGELRVGFRVAQKSIPRLGFRWREMKESLHGLEMRDVASPIIAEIVGVIRWHISLGDERVDIEVRDGTVEVGNEGGIVHAASHSLYCYCVALLCAQRFQPLRVRHPRPCQSPEGPFLAGADIRGCRRRIPRSPRAIRAGSRSCIVWIGFLNDLFYAELYRRIGRVVNFRLCLMKKPRL